ncbi:hypothetical protein [Micromonospora echinaurantiaca]|uniref:hypothetical protein n=1 Tax=Micromonospora echinaurantiaca TaxID=47857 RepID=UPI003435586D
MDEEALVEALVADGSRLESAFRKETGQSWTTPPITAFDVELGQWQILFPLPGSMSRISAYDLLQKIIRTLGLNLTIDQIVLVKAADRGLRELRGSVSTYGPRHIGRQPPVEVAGRLFADPRILSVDPRTFEQQVSKALRRVLPGAQVMDERELNQRRKREKMDRLRHNWLFHNPARPDITVFSGNSVLLVEAKAPRRPLPASAVMASLGLLMYATRKWQEVRVAGMILVSALGFTSQVEAEFGLFEDFKLVSWDDEEGEILLGDAAHQLLR